MNKNAIPFDTNPPLKPSGIRIGTPALTTRGMKEPEMQQVGKWISEVLHNRTDKALLARVSREVLELAEAFPLYASRTREARGGSQGVASFEFRVIRGTVGIRNISSFGDPSSEFCIRGTTLVVPNDVW